MAFILNLNDTTEFVIKSCHLGHKIKLLTPNGWLISSKILKKLKKSQASTWSERPGGGQFFFPKYYSFLNNYLSVTAQTLKMQPSRQLFVQKMMDTFKFLLKAILTLKGKFCGYFIRGYISTIHASILLKIGNWHFFRDL